MKLREITDGCVHLDVHEKRCDREELFEKAFENGVIIAKFWPWKDDRCITSRMALLPTCS